MAGFKTIDISGRMPDIEIYHDLMRFRVREILLVSTQYDAFVLEQEGRITERIFAEYFNLSLSNAPRVTSVSSGKKALEKLAENQYDLVILMTRLDDTSPFELSRRIKEMRDRLPILLLLKDTTEVAQVKSHPEQLRYIDQTFLWNGDSKVFVAMTKYVEDRENVHRDTRFGMVRVILLVEDSIRYLSRFLPVLYTEIIRQTQALIAEEQLDDMRKLLRMRARPKVLLVNRFEDAVGVVERFREFLLCVISDVRFPKGGKEDAEAGIQLLKHVREIIPDVPVVLQSSEPHNREMADMLQAYFIDKNSPNLAEDLKDFIQCSLGFGEFVFRMPDGSVVGRAKTLAEMERQLREVSEKSLEYHGLRNHFSAWLMARGEIQIAKRIHPIKVQQFESLEALRSFLIEVFQKAQFEGLKGRIVNFDPRIMDQDGLVLRLADGSLGGKGRGIAFINALLHRRQGACSVPGADIKIPRTAIIGTDAFDQFMEDNHLKDVFNGGDSEQDIRKRFLSGRLTLELEQQLATYLKTVTRPLAIRSSSLFEDSISQPFSGVYPTYLLPNNHPDLKVRLKHVMTAVKLIFAGVFSPGARAYFDAIHYSSEEEKMAVVIQELVGSERNGYFYPHFSGIAQSYNYYPFSYIKPEDGLAVVALGLGKYVVEGEMAYRFCPRHPKLNISTEKELIRNTQTHFYAVDMSRMDADIRESEDITLATLNISEAERAGVLERIASVWDFDNDRMEPGLDRPGPRVIDFGPILKYDTFPLPRLIRYCLDVFEEAMGTAVELEFAVDLERNYRSKTNPTFYLLQIKHFIRSAEDFDLSPDDIRFEDCFIWTEKGMGNGRIDGLTDIVYIDPDRFDKSETLRIRDELERFNKSLKASGREYILIGPGRWGTRDRWLGIPVEWTQISNAKVIVEVGLKDFQVDASLGSHFFHNITSMNIGYFTIGYNDPKGKIDWSWLASLPEVERGSFVVHVRSGKPLNVLMDGRKRLAVIYKPDGS